MSEHTFSQSKRPRRMAREPRPGTAPADVQPGASTQTSSDLPGTSPAIPRAGTKIAEVLGLLGRQGGASLAEIVEATGWLPHTARAALTGLKKKGHVLTKESRGGVSCYRLGLPA